MTGQGGCRRTSSAIGDNTQVELRIGTDLAQRAVHSYKSMAFSSPRLPCRGRTMHTMRIKPFLVPVEGGVQSRPHPVIRAAPCGALFLPARLRKKEEGREPALPVPAALRGIMCPCGRDARSRAWQSCPSRCAAFQESGRTRAVPCRRRDFSAGTSSRCAYRPLRSS